MRLEVLTSYRAAGLRERSLGDVEVLHAFGREPEVA